MATNCAPSWSARLDEAAELEVLVAHHAGIGRAAGLVFIGEVLDDLALKLRRLVYEVIGDAQLMADRARVGDRLRAAAFVLGARDAVLRPQLEGDAHHVVALFQQERGGGRGIDSSAHPDYDACLLLRTHKPVNIRARRRAVKRFGGSRNRSRPHAQAIKARSAVGGAGISPQEQTIGVG